MGINSKHKQTKMTKADVPNKYKCHAHIFLEDAAQALPPF